MLIYIEEYGEREGNCGESRVVVAREVPGARVEGDNDDHLQLNSVPDIMVIDKENGLNPIN